MNVAVSMLPNIVASIINDAPILIPRIRIVVKMEEKNIVKCFTEMLTWRMWVCCTEVRPRSSSASCVACQCWLSVTEISHQHDRTLQLVLKLHISFNSAFIQTHFVSMSWIYSGQQVGEMGQHKWDKTNRNHKHYFGDITTKTQVVSE